MKLPDGNIVTFYTDDSLEKELQRYGLKLEQKLTETEQLLEDQQNFIHEMINVIPDPIWVKDLDGKYLKCNTRFEQLYGAKESEILGKTDFDFVDEKLAKFFRKNDKLALESKTSRTNEEYLAFADGSHEGEFETIKTPIKNKDGKVIGVLGIARDIQDRKEKEKQLEIYAHYDLLTGLVNRTLFINRLHQLLKKRHTPGKYHSILFIDLDHFKDINDSLGHAAGDKVLVETAQRIQESVREGDTVARLGGDEFTVLLENINSKQEAQKIAQKIVHILREPFYLGTNIVHVTSSIGISISPDDSTQADELLNYADKAMYYAKADQKDTYHFYSN